MNLRAGLRGGGWVVLASILVSVAWVLRILLVRTPQPEKIVGDHRHVASYGFDLADLRIPRETLVASPISRDGLPVIDAPALIDASAADRLNEEIRGKYLVSTDPVIGIVEGADARAYPLRVLNWHEVINDTVGGRPVVVTYHPISGSAVVLDRRCGGATLLFGLSGLFANSHHLLYDRDAPAGKASLWCPLTATAVSGPRAGTRLQVLASFLGPWSAWRARHPTTRVIDPDRQRLADYQKAPYTGTRAPHLLRFPVAPLPTDQADGPTLKSRILALSAGGSEQIFLVSRPPAGVQPEVAHRVTIGTRAVDLTWRQTPIFAAPWLEVTPIPLSDAAAAETATLATFHAYWFAWFAFHPRSRPVMDG